MSGNVGFFRRGPGPLVTVMIASRGRPEHLAHSVDSLYSLAGDRSLVEFVLKADEDDSATIECGHRIARVAPLRMIVTPRGNGFADMHLWVNAMAAEARGDWLLCVNDDHRMLTQDWDQILLNTTVGGFWHPCVNEVCLFIPETNNDPTSNETFLLRKATHDLLGHVCLSPYGDSWIVQVMDLVQSITRFPLIKLEHHRERVLDETRGQTDAKFLRAISTLVSVEAIWKKMADAGKLLDYIEKVMGESTLSAPREHGWHYWAPPSGRRGVYLLYCGDWVVSSLGGALIRTRLPKEGAGGRWWLTSPTSHADLSGVGKEVRWEDFNTDSMYIPFATNSGERAAGAGNGAETRRRMIWEMSGGT